ncbi:MAG: hypothetical protein L6R41_004834 [Letrouitia leprolyta]|nr:MAG: hypothetical protein L6R41_004834 [Letrouitia leprolyta]
MVASKTGLASKSLGEDTQKSASANASSRKRAKARKQGSLQALLEKSRGADSIQFESHQDRHYLLNYGGKTPPGGPHGQASARVKRKNSIGGPPGQASARVKGRFQQTNLGGQNPRHLDKKFPWAASAQVKVGQ